MGFFDKLKTDEAIEEEKDTLGGFTPRESGAYDFTIELAYIDYSKSGAMNVNFHFADQAGKHRETIYVTSGKEKGMKTYYETKDGKKRNLPGFTTVNHICMLAADVKFTDIEPEEKVLSLYNYDLGKEAPTKKMVLTDLIGKDITLGLIQTKEPKYNDPDKIITKVETDRVFRTEDHMTVNELLAEAETAEFYDKWVEAKTGKVVDKTNGKSSSSSAPKEEKKSLFNK